MVAASRFAQQSAEKKLFAVATAALFFGFFGQFAGLFAGPFFGGADGVFGFLAGSSDSVFGTQFFADLIALLFGRQLDLFADSVTGFFAVVALISMPIYRRWRELGAPSAQPRS